MQNVLNDQEPTLPPQEPRLLRASPAVEVCIDRGCFGFSPGKSHRKVRPFDTGPDPHHSRFLKSQTSGRGDALRKEKALLHTFVAGQKYGVGRDATRRFCF